MARKLSIENINILVPEHERTSCSDKDLSNRFLNGEGNVECLRCYLLDNKSDLQNIEDLPIKIDVYARPSLLNKE